MLFAPGSVALSLVPVASKNASNGEMPAVRTTFACNVRLPLLAVHEGPPAVVVPEATFTVTDWLALPPEPLQVSM